MKIKKKTLRRQCEIVFNTRREKQSEDDFDYQDGESFSTLGDLRTLRIWKVDYFEKGKFFPHSSALPLFYSMIFFVDAERNLTAALSGYAK